MAKKRYTIKYGTKELSRDIERLTFADAIASERQCRNLTLRKCAALLGLSVQSLSDIEKGKKVPSPTIAKNIACAIGEPEAYWIQLALQDKLRDAQINLTVTVA